MGENDLEVLSTSCCSMKEEWITQDVPEDLQIIGVYGEIDHAACIIINMGFLVWRTADL